MSELETITLARSKKDVFIGKVIFLVIVGCVGGYFLGLDRAADFAEAERLTMEEHIAGFEHHRVDLAKGPSSVPAGIGTLLAAAFICSGVYELFGRLFGAVMGKVLRRGG